MHFELDIFMFAKHWLKYKPLSMSYRNDKQLASS